MSSSGHKVSALKAFSYVALLANRFKMNTDYFKGVVPHFFNDNKYKKSKSIYNEHISTILKGLVEERY